MITNVLLDNMKTGLKTVYLLCGDNAFLKKYTIDAIKQEFETRNPMSMLDLNIQEKLELQNFVSAVETYPIGYRKLVFVNTLTPEVSTDTDKIVNEIKKIPETTTVIFCIDAVDKRQKLYKAIQKAGVVVELGELSQSQLTSWLIDEATKQHTKLNTYMANYLVEYAGTDMFKLANEIKKLSSLGKEITKEKIDSICTKSIQMNIFQFTDALANRQIKEAIDIIENMNEEPIKVLVMIFNQFSNMYQIKNAISNGVPQNNIGKETGIHPYVIKKTIPISNRYSLAQLKKVIKLSYETDLAIKTGVLAPDIAMNTLISNIGGALK